MSRAVELVVPVEVDAPAQRVWEAVIDWQGQGSWIFATRVRPTRGAGRGVGDRVTAVTGFGPLRVVDEFEITGWDPPRRCEVRHLGRVVRGIGIFQVESESPARSRFVWTERLDLPLGRLGVLAWPVIRPAFAAGVRRSLQRFADLVAAGRIGPAGDPPPTAGDPDPAAGDPGVSGPGPSGG